MAHTFCLHIQKKSKKKINCGGRENNFKWLHVDIHTHMLRMRRAFFFRVFVYFEYCLNKLFSYKFLMK